MRKIIGIILEILFIWMCVIPVCAQDGGCVVVKDRASFYQEISKQILSHQKSKVYITDVGSLGNDLDELLNGYIIIMMRTIPLQVEVICVTTWRVGR